MSRLSTLRITFLLPGSGRLPCGGVKIVYEYANRLARRGHTVSVVHPALLRTDTPLIARPKKIANYIVRRAFRSFTPSGWFQIDPDVQLLWVPSLAQRHIPDADVVIATAWETAEWIQSYPASKGRRFYFIQDFEDWCVSRERLLETWKAPLRKIVIARWLDEIAHEVGQAADYVPNALDFDKFGIDVDPEARDSLRVMMLYHRRNTKGTADGLEAAEIARRYNPDLSLVLFGTPDPPAGLPSWAKYHQNPPQSKLRELYNQAAVFIAPSWAEGWGLTACEAMMSGAALAATDNGGHREFAVHQQTALVSPAKSPAALAANISRLVSDSELRYRLARNASIFVKQFEWDRSVDAFERCLSRA